MKLLHSFFVLSVATVTFLETAPAQDAAARDQLIIAAADAANQAPRFNGAMIAGVRPETPLLYSLAVSGEQPLSFAAKNLPAGLALDPATGIITGSLNKAGDYVFTATASNAIGKTSAEIKIVCGDELALTPPMGWNSYDAFGDSVTEDETLANADWMKDHLQAFGWNIIVVDFRWYDSQPTGDDHLLNKTRMGAKLEADEFGRLLPAPNRFPSATNGVGFKALADRLHSAGLKFGIHVMRGIPRQAVIARTKLFGTEFSAADAGITNDVCSWCPDMFGVRDNAAGQAWYDSCAKLWSEWGVDYIKVDDLSEPYHAGEIEMISRAIKKFGRSIIFSTSPGPAATSHGGHLVANANLWRISGDFWDKWQKLNMQYDLLAQWQGAARPGHWPDADMIPLGYIAIRSKVGGSPHSTHFTRDEQLSLMSLWSMAPSPLMLGMNLPDNSEWATALLVNPEVIAINQDPDGKPAHRVFVPQMTAEVWVKNLSGGAKAVGFFNRFERFVKVDCEWRNLGLSAEPRVRDVWVRKNLDRRGHFVTELPPHGCILLRVEE